MLKPLEDRVILRRYKSDEQKTSSGFILNQLKGDEDNQAEVVAIGEGRLFKNGTRAESDFVVGDRVVFNPLAVQYTEHDGEEYLVIFTADIIAVIEGNND